MEDVSAESVAAVVAALVGLVTVMYRAPKVYRQLKNWWNKMFGIGDLRTDVSCLAKQLEQHTLAEDTNDAAVAVQLKLIVAELHPNGGASIRDSLNRIETRQVLQEQRQKAILSDMSVGVFETDAEGHCIWANRKYLRMTGRTLAEVAGSGWTNIIASEDRDRVVKGWADSIDEQREFEDEYYIATPEGVKTKVRAQSYRMDQQNGSPIGYLGMLTPIDKQGQRQH